MLPLYSKALLSFDESLNRKNVIVPNEYAKHNKPPHEESSYKKGESASY